MSSAISLNVTNTKTIPGTLQCDVSIYLAHRWNSWKNRSWIITKMISFLPRVTSALKTGSIADQIQCRLYD